MFLNSLKLWQEKNCFYTEVVKDCIFEDNSLVDVVELVERRKTPPQLKRCVRAVALQNGGDVSKAFAICTAQLQKHGYLKKGTAMPTKAGKASGRSKAAEKEHMNKLGDYEMLLRINRKRN